jgi:predicted transcriptional regulator
MTKHLTFELSEEQAAFLQATAEREARTVDQVVADIVQQQIDYDAWFRRKVKEGIDAADRGDLISHEEFVADGERVQRELIAKSRDA